MTTQTEVTLKNHQRAVRFFWCLLIGATTVSLTGNVVHAILPYVPYGVIQIGAAAVPPIALLAAVHGIALAVLMTSTPLRTLSIPLRTACGR
jgi:hypothetical protein